MIEIFRRLFLGRRDITLDEVREALQEVEKDRRKSRLEVRRWERKRKKTLEKLKKARADGNQLEVDYLWDDFKDLRLTGRELRRAGRIHNAEGLALKRYIRALENLERRNDREGSRRLLERLQGSGVLERLSLERENEIQLLDEMNSILEDFDASSSELDQEDPEKALFLAELDSIREAEEKGEAEEVEFREEELLERFGGEAVEEEN